MQALLERALKVSVGSALGGAGKTICTHSGSFHCDEVLACFMLRLTDEFQDADIVRSRDPAVIDGSTIVVDVGAVYDNEKLRYDHHQATFQDTFKSPLRSYNTRLSSAGLVYKHFGQDVLKKLAPNLGDKELVVVYDKLYRSFVEGLDGVDNGVEAHTAVHMDGSPAPECKVRSNYSLTCTLPGRVSRLNPRWNGDQSSDGVNEKFRQAMRVVGEEFISYLDGYVNSWLPARTFVEQAAANRREVHPSGHILKLPHYCPWAEHLYDIEDDTPGLGDAGQEPLFVLFEDSSGGWRVQCVGVRDQAFVNRQSLKKEWQGVRDQELSTLSGIPECVFVHANGFIGGNKTYEGARQMAVLSLPEK